MIAVPLELQQSNDFVNTYHRHHKAVHRDKFRVGCEIDGKLVGVVNVGRPVSRRLQDGKTLEVLRLCSTGERNVCSFLYSRAARIAKEMGYEKIITYILENEIGTSLKASGWVCEAKSCGGGSWDVPSRHRQQTAPTCKKQRWVKYLNDKNGQRT